MRCTLTAGRVGDPTRRVEAPGGRLRQCVTLDTLPSTIGLPDRAANRTQAGMHTRTRLSRGPMRARVSSAGRTKVRWWCKSRFTSEGGDVCQCIIACTRPRRIAGGDRIELHADVRPVRTRNSRRPGRRGGTGTRAPPATQRIAFRRGGGRQSRVAAAGDHRSTVLTPRATSASN